MWRKGEFPMNETPRHVEGEQPGKTGHRDLRSRLRRHIRTPPARGHATFRRTMVNSPPPPKKNDALEGALARPRSCTFEPRARLAGIRSPPRRWHPRPRRRALNSSANKSRSTYCSCWWRRFSNVSNVSSGPFFRIPAFSKIARCLATDIGAICPWVRASFLATTVRCMVHLKPLSFRGQSLPLRFFEFSRQDRINTQM